MIEDEDKKKPPKDNKEITAQFGQNLKALRNKKGLSRKALAADLKMSEIAIVSYERGIRQPNLFILCNIASYFNVSIDELIGHFDTTREQRAVEKFRLERGIDLLSNVGEVVEDPKLESDEPARPGTYGLFAVNKKGPFVTLGDSKIKIPKEFTAAFFENAYDLIEFAENIQRKATFSQEDFTTVFWKNDELVKAELD